jgi:sugar transferase (PEP-CTERM system associated)
MRANVVRLFNVYYPLRSLLLLCGEALVICGSFIVASRIEFGADSHLVLNLEYGYYKILAVTGIAVICSHYFDLYDPERFAEGSLVYFRLMVVLGTFSIILAGLGFCFPRLMLGKHVLLLGLVILTAALITWRSSYGWLIRRPYLMERIYVLGDGELAQRLVQALWNRPDLGMEVAGRAETLSNEFSNRKTLQSDIAAVLKKGQGISRIVLAMPDRRGTIPVAQLLNLRLRGVRIEDATTLLEQISGKIEIDDLHPSWLILSDGFHVDSAFVAVRSVISRVISLACLVPLLPLLALIALAIKASSPGPVLYRQERVGRNGVVFTCYKFRTMRTDAEAGTGPAWAGDDDPRITPLGRILRKSRLDEIPQLWNVVKGEMALVGPRPERPEFVKWLSKAIPYYALRHAIRPGITGWAQVNYKYGSSVEDAKEKLKYDLFYIKNMSFGLDLTTLLYTTKVVLLGRGAK